VNKLAPGKRVIIIIPGQAFHSFSFNFNQKDVEETLKNILQELSAGNTLLECNN
jgi:hypothetical protein